MPTAQKVSFAADAFFDFDKAVLKPEGKAKLDDVTSKLGSINLEVIIAVGHTDSVGTDDYNQKLSVRRAEAVKAYIISKGVEANRVYTEGKGEKQPVADNKSAGRPRQEPSRRNRSGRHQQVISAAPHRTPPRRGFFYARCFRIAGLVFTIKAHERRSIRTAKILRPSRTAGGTPTSEFRPLHEINPLRLEWINARAPAGRQERHRHRLCGGGILSESMARKGATVTGIDLSEKALKVADLHSLESGVQVRYKLIAAEEMAAQEAGRFDVVTCMEMLEHVPDPAAIVRAAATLVKPGGHVFFSTLNRNPKAYLFAILGAEYLLRMLPKGTHDYDKFHHAVRAVAIHPQRRPGAARLQGHGLQSADQDLFPERRHQRQLPGRHHPPAVKNCCP